MASFSSDALVDVEAVELRDARRVSGEVAEEPALEEDPAVAGLVVLLPDPPFMRRAAALLAAALAAAPPPVWTVVTGCLISPRTWTCRFWSASDSDTVWIGGPVSILRGNRWGSNL